MIRILENKKMGVLDALLKPLPVQKQLQRDHVLLILKTRYNIINHDEIVHNLIIRVMGMTLLVILD